MSNENIISDLVVGTTTFSGVIARILLVSMMMFMLPLIVLKIVAMWKLFNKVGKPG